MRLIWDLIKNHVEYFIASYDGFMYEPISWRPTSRIEKNRKKEAKNNNTVQLCEKGLRETHVLRRSDSDFESVWRVECLF